ncbi:EpsG family protein [uncultured Prevotella sp.]|uniref:EpsG family protein n=1 Tax=uncultured Prevotella sp. TaxID=159272 RepID=UPI0025E41554|nr:EpsG family protein [uncultured Prevotella sp.]
MIFSFILYFFFFLGLFYLDNIKNKKKKSFFLFFLYVFLCFGYMTGSDWRYYELDFRESNLLVNYNDYDKGFWLVYYLLSKISSDFFVAVAILKCIYLYSLIYAFKKISDHWMAAMGIMFTMILFMIVDNPLRFMVANIFINFAIPYAFAKKLKKFLLISLWAVFFHMTSIFPILLLLLGFLRIPIEKVNKHTIFLIYIVIAIICSDEMFISEIFNNAQFFLNYVGDTRNYESYSVESNESFFTIGSALKVFLAAIIIYNRDKVISMKNGNQIYFYSILYLIIGRVILLIPTGFRMVIPLSFFYSAAFAYLIMENKAKIMKYCFIALFSLTLFRTLNNTYVYIPYSNSIYYILTKHKPFVERSNYNFDSYKERTGKSVGDKN